LAVQVTNTVAISLAAGSGSWQLAVGKAVGAWLDCNKNPVCRCRYVTLANGSMCLALTPTLALLIGRQNRDCAAFALDLRLWVYAWGCTPR
jgi:hypothetical protein